MMNCMNIFGILNLLIAVVIGFSVSPVSAQDLSPKGVACKAPTFSEENIISIVARERAINPKLPPKIENGIVSVHRKRCHYVYTEMSRSGGVAHRPKLVTISEFGSIVDFLDGRAIESSSACPEVEYSVEQIAKFLQLSRERFTGLPKQPKEFTSRIHKMRCMYVYYEIPVLPDEGKGHKYIFDYYGNLFNFRTLD